MNFYRFIFSNGSTICFPCRPDRALHFGAWFARCLNRELVRIKEDRPVSASELVLA